MDRLSLRYFGVYMITGLQNSNDIWRYKNVKILKFVNIMVFYLLVSWSKKLQAGRFQFRKVERTRDGEIRRFETLKLLKSELSRNPFDLWVSILRDSKIRRSESDAIAPSDRYNPHSTEIFKSSRLIHSRSVLSHCRVFFNLNNTRLPYSYIERTLIRLSSWGSFPTIFAYPNIHKVSLPI